MASYAASNDDSAATKRARALSMLAGLLGIVMFLLGFLRWLSLGEGDEQLEYSGFALQMPTTTVIGLSLAAGLIAALAAADRRRGRGVPSAVPTGLAAASLLVAIGIYLGKGAISQDLGDDVGVEIGLILALLVALVQTAVLAVGLADRYDTDDDDIRTRR